MLKWMAVVGVVLSGLGLNGCSSLKDPDSDPTHPLSAQDFAEGYAETLCESLSGCCAEAQLQFGGSDCSNRVSQDMQRQLDASATEGYVAYDPAAAAACLSILKSAARCGDSDTFATIPACDQIFAGTLQDGDGCYGSRECKSGYCEVLDQDTYTGVCAKPKPSANEFVRGKFGDPCAFDCDDETCSSWTGTSLATGAPGPHDIVCLRGDGLACFDNACRRLGQDGDACAFDEDCKDGYYCFGQRRCTPKLAEGESCSQDTDCTSGRCAEFKCATPVSAEQCASGMP